MVHTQCDKLSAVKKNCRPRSGAAAGLVAVFSVFFNFASAVSDTPRDFEINGSYYGLSLESQSHGSAFGGFYSFPIKKKIQAFFQGRILDIAGEAEYPVYDWYTGTYYKANTRNLLLLPVSAGVKFHPFLGKIANNFSPFAMFTAGPTVILDLPERAGFVEQWKNLHTMLSGGAFIGIGLDFFVRPGSFMGMVIGYDYLPMGREVDGRRDYSGMIIKFLIGKRRKS